MKTLALLLLITFSAYAQPGYETGTYKVENGRIEFRYKDNDLEAFQRQYPYMVEFSVSALDVLTGDIHVVPQKKYFRTKRAAKAWIRKQKKSWYVGDLKMGRL